MLAGDVWKLYLHFVDASSGSIGDAIEQDRVAAVELDLHLPTLAVRKALRIDEVLVSVGAKADAKVARMGDEFIPDHPDHLAGLVNGHPLAALPIGDAARALLLVHSLVAVRRFLKVDVR